MGSLSLIIVLIIVVWVIVLAPIVMGGNKPIQHSGDGLDETRVLHEGGTEPVARRRRPRLTPADVHRHDEGSGEEYEVVEDVTTDSAPAVVEEDPEGVLDGEVVVEAPGSTALSVLQAREAEVEEQEFYDVDDSYVSPADFGYDAPADAPEATEADGASQEPDAESAAESAEHSGDPEDAVADDRELTEEELAFAARRRGRGGFDPERERAARADRYKRRQRTLLGLIVADVIAFVAAFVAGGWAWAAPAATVALTVCFMLALRSVVKKERALHTRRVRQLRRARLGVVSAQANPERRRHPGTIDVELDDLSPDFEHLETFRPAPAVSYEYDDYRRAS